ncbi:DUF72 domain-containing protein [Pedobacter xixiisoli]|uniref:Uncharacterized conserved protein YecE, DUF72 family n=1 Tax=Pedobacter xixiisoli TaxID=1476464 RepID=A0A285ZWJ8_9SPHI|nr:DUF72 domain-containing protein [Pedobacter xixiisoli]SOD13998.1 Uncharacterized conserved protein YecE, DUF72 family [Pedobacter xixiisoli]
MEFGRPEKDILLIDHTLPADGRVTAQVLSAGAAERTKFHVGCAKWGRKEWVGHLYPDKTPEKEFLTEYGKRFDTIEFAASFFTRPDRESMVRWLDRVKLAGNDDFMFIPKVSKEISHISRLENTGELLKDFISAVEGFGPHLGPMLLQLSDSFGTKYFERMKNFVEQLPKEHRFFIELRHENWFSDETSRRKVFELFREYGVGTVITDTSGRRDCLHMELTTPDLYVRFNGNGEEHQAHDRQRVDDWAHRIADWKGRGLKNVYFILSQTKELDTPALAAYAIERFNEQLGAGLKSVVWNP